VLSHEHDVPRPAPLHVWWMGQDVPATEMKGQLSGSTVQVENVFASVQNVPFPVHAASPDALQTQLLAPAVPPQL
jgi:hypothetical protein